MNNPLKTFCNYLIYIGLLFVLGCNSPKDCSYQIPVDLGDGLVVSSLEESKLDEHAFARINHDICEGTYGNIHSLLIIQDGKLVVEQYYHDWDGERLHFLASTTKSFNAIFIGMAIEQGKIKGVDQKMLDFFPEYASLKSDSLKNLITIKDLLTNTSGFLWDEQSLPPDDPENMGKKIDLTDDWFQASLTLEMDTTPGTKYVYSGPNNIILGEIIKRATGSNVADFANEHLFKSLEINDYQWDEKNGIVDMGGGLWLRSRDIAKYALLHANRGIWNSDTVVSEQWIDEVFTPFMEINHPFYSCYQWRLIETKFGIESLFISGNGGQIISIIPSLDMVVVINADNRQVSKKKRKPLSVLMDEILLLHPQLNKTTTATTSTTNTTINTSTTSTTITTSTTSTTITTSLQKVS
jgi:CubicO group peptidase (beta-lactamase class C family)